jgi:hypothetical protein
MADAVVSNVVMNTVSTDGKYTIHLAGVSDGTGESAVVKIDKSAFTSYDGAEPNIIAIMSARWNIQGYSSIRLLADHTTDDLLLALSGNGYDNWEAGGGLRDPASSGGTGDLLLTSVGAASGATYDITLEVMMK